MDLHHVDTDDKVTYAEACLVTILIKRDGCLSRCRLWARLCRPSERGISVYYLVGQILSCVSVCGLISGRTSG